MAALKVVVCVPWRPGQKRREWNWKVVEPYLRQLSWPLFTGDSQGPWSRAAACNDAARKARQWDVAVFADADTIPEDRAVRAAVELAVETDGAVRPHDHLWGLNFSETMLVATRGPRAWRRRNPDRLLPGGGLLVVSRVAWDKVGGHDERFSGWGHEDSYLNTMLLVKAHWDRVPGNAYHLWHPRDNADTPERARNRRMMRDIQRRHRRRIDAESEERGWDIGSVL